MSDSQLVHSRFSYADYLADELVEDLTKAFPEGWWEGKPVRLRFWMRWLFALISKDWNRIHFYRIVPIEQHRSAVAHGLMLTILMPRLTQEWCEKLRKIAGSRRIIDTALSCKFVGFCRTHSYVRIRVRCKSIRKEGDNVFTVFEFEILATNAKDQVIQKGTRTLLITRPA